MPRAILGLELFKLVVILLALVTLGRMGPLWACTAVGIAFGAHAFASLWVVRRVDGIPLRRMLANLGPGVTACAPMAMSALCPRWLMTASGGAPLYARLTIGIAVRGISYPAAPGLMSQN